MPSTKCASRNMRDDDDDDDDDDEQVVEISEEYCQRDRATHDEFTSPYSTNGSGKYETPDPDPDPEREDERCEIGDPKADPKDPDDDDDDDDDDETLKCSGGTWEHTWERHVNVQQHKDPNEHTDIMLMPSTEEDSFTTREMYLWAPMRAGGHE